MIHLNYKINAISFGLSDMPFQSFHSINPSICLRCIESISSFYFPLVSMNQ